MGVSADTSSKFNPLNMILNNFSPEDLVVVKLDIDTPAVELPIAHQILHDERFHSLVDHFYFEHHVGLEELRRSWGRSVNGSVLSSLQYFSALRSKGIAAHYWV